MIRFFSPDEDTPFFLACLQLFHTPFGIAIVADKTKSIDISGTPPYMAPEQFQGKISKKSDQYALACIAYELFTGQKPFTAPDFYAMAFKHFNDIPTNPTRLNSGLPLYIAQALLKAMAKKHEDRYADIEAFVAALYKSAQQWRDEGDVLYAATRYKEAIVVYEKALQLDNHLPVVHNSKGNALWMLNRYEEALVCYEQAAYFEPDNALFHGNKALVLLRLNRFEEALAAYGRASRLDPKSASYRRNKDYVFEQLRIKETGKQPAIPPSGLVKNGHDEAEKPLPFNIRQLGNNNLGLVVGTQTNPGIKRKHKPNEDSVFAAQGAGMFNASPQPFGLFVVADGLADYANGQDASRLAIQTIINYLLPRLEKGEALDRYALTQLLVEGVQQANQAVFQHNLEQRADMRTTMTSALVVGVTAIVANVGDSRTYLYREPQGLTKVTNDHSVASSLVETGIIKPDDIYTHPQRNQLYRSLGEKPAIEVDAFFVDLLPGDKLLLCSDGLWHMVRDPNIQQILRHAAPNPDQTGEALIQAALNGGGEDNVSVIVVYITDTNQATGISGLRLLTKPETVQMPQL